MYDNKLRLTSKNEEKEPTYQKIKFLIHSPDDRSKASLITNILCFRKYT